MSRSPRCALLFALPVDRASFDRVARGELLTDYRGLLFRTAATEPVWNERYSRIASAAQDLMRVAASLEAECITNATLPDLAHVSSGRDVVIVIGHWRGWVVSDGDWTGAPFAIQERLATSGLGLLVPREQPPDLRALTRACNSAIEDGTLLRQLEPRLAAGFTNPTLRATLGRDILDEQLEGLVAPGNRLELADGLHTPSAVEAALHQAFRGVIDLATCSSIALATLIARRRGAAVTVVHSLALVDPLVCCLVLAETLRSLASHGGAYAPARLDTEERLIDVKRQLNTRTLRQ